MSKHKPGPWEYSCGEMRLAASKEKDVYVVYCKRKEGTISLSFQELCQLSEIIEKILSTK